MNIPWLSSRRSSVREHVGLYTAYIETLKSFMHLRYNQYKVLISYSNRQYTSLCSCGMSRDAYINCLKCFAKTSDSLLNKWARVLQEPPSVNLNSDFFYKILQAKMGTQFILVYMQTPIELYLYILFLFV